MLKVLVKSDVRLKLDSLFTFHFVAFGYVYILDF